MVDYWVPDWVLRIGIFGLFWWRLAMNRREAIKTAAAGGVSFAGLMAWSHQLSPEKTRSLIWSHKVPVTIQVTYSGSSCGTAKSEISVAYKMETDGETAKMLQRCLPSNPVNGEGEWAEIASGPSAELQRLSIEHFGQPHEVT